MAKNISFPFHRTHLDDEAREKEKIFKIIFTQTKTKNKKRVKNKKKLLWEKCAGRKASYNWVVVEGGGEENIFKSRSL